MDLLEEDIPKALAVRDMFEPEFGTNTVTITNVSDRVVAGMILGDCVQPIDVTLEGGEKTATLAMAPDEGGNLWVSIQFGRDLLYYEPPIGQEPAGV